MGLEIFGLPQRERQIRRERALGLEPLGIRGTRHCLRRYSELVAVPPPGATATVTARTQTRFLVDRLLVPNAIVRDFVIEDIRIGNADQIVGEGLPAEMFSAQDAHLAMDPVQANQDLSVTVRYVGVDPNGAVFRAAIAGRDAEGRGMMLPLDTSVPVGSARDGAWTSRAATLRYLAARSPPPLPRPPRSTAARSSLPPPRLT